MDPALPLDWLCCPLSGQPLHRADAALVARVEAARTAGTLHFFATPAVLQSDLAQPLTGVLIREDGEALYLVEGDIPLLLPDHAIAAPPAATSTP